MPRLTDPQFDREMERAVNLHSSGDVLGARILSNQAFKGAEPGSSRQGRAARDNAARSAALDEMGLAEYWADLAFGIHDSIVHDTPDRDSYRERAATQFCLGAIGTLRLVKVDLLQDLGRPDSAPDFIVLSTRPGLADIEEAKKLAPVGINRDIDQYEINGLSRAAVAESLFGKRERGLSLGSRAVRWAFMTESPKLDTSNPKLGTLGRLKAKARALERGVVSVGVGLLASPEPNFRRKLALTMSKRAL